LSLTRLKTSNLPDQSIKKLNMKSKWIVLATIILGFAACKKSSTPGLATVTTANAIAITSNSAKSGGYVTSDGGATVTERGVCYGVTANPTTDNNKVISGSGTGIFDADLTGLEEGTLYHIRAYAINSAGTSYGQDVQFTTDFETVKIGSQTWMKNNLDVSVYRNGDSIQQVKDGTAWAALTTGAWCFNNNDVANESDYGKLYNWYAVTDSRNIAPLGWHLPTDAEWATLVSLTGGNTAAGDVLKEAGTTHWTSPNSGATNSSGFTGLPGGGRGVDGAFISTGGLGSWWTSSEDSPGSFTAVCYQMNYNQSGVNRGSAAKVTGFSVRCVKD
jgi:uncharacterized protein (TIGR02145 family)